MSATNSRLNWTVTKVMQHMVHMQMRMAV